MPGMDIEGKSRTVLAIESDNRLPTIQNSTPRIVEQERPTNISLGDITLSVSEIIDRTAAEDATNYELRSSGANGIFDDADDVHIGIAPTYIDGTHAGDTSSIRLALANPLAEGSYRLTVKSSGTVDPAGNLLDGSQAGVPSDYVRTFVVDQTGPTVSIDPITPNIRNIPVPEILLQFDEVVNGIGIANLDLNRDSTFDLLSGSQIVETVGLPNMDGSDIWRLTGIADLDESDPAPWSLAEITMDEGELELFLQAALGGNSRRRWKSAFCWRHDKLDDGYDGARRNRPTDRSRSTC